MHIIYLPLSVGSPIHLSIYLCLHPSIHLLIHQSVHLPIHPSIHLAIHPFTHPSTYSSVPPSIHPSIHPPIHLPIHPVIHRFIHPLIHPSIHCASTDPPTRPFLVCQPTAHPWMCIGPRPVPVLSGAEMLEPEGAALSRCLSCLSQQPQRWPGFTHERVSLPFPIVPVLMPRLECLGFCWCNLLPQDTCPPQGWVRHRACQNLLMLHLLLAFPPFLFFLFEANGCRSCPPWWWFC